MKEKMLAILAKWFLGGIFRDIAEGKKWPAVTKIYWALVGQKLLISFGLGTVAAAIAYFNPDLARSAAPGLAMVISLGIAAGLVDKGFRATAPPVEWAKTFSQIMSVGPVLSAAVALIVEWVPKVPNCDWCDPLAAKIQLWVAATAAATAWLSARFAEAPVVPVEVIGRG
jgi:hypothetical protein